VHSGGASGSGQSADSRGNVEDVDPAVLKAAARTGKLESIGRALNVARRQIRNDKVNPELLKDLGMTSRGFRSFVDKYTEKYHRIRKNLDQAGPREFRAGGIDMVGSGSLSEGSSTVIDGAGDSRSGTQQDKQLRETRARKVAPEYRKKLEEYFRSVGKGRTGT
jgi:hypothetical protein